MLGGWCGDLVGGEWVLVGEVSAKDEGSGALVQSARCCWCTATTTTAGRRVAKASCRFVRLLLRSQLSAIGSLRRLALDQQWSSEASYFLPVYWPRADLGALPAPYLRAATRAAP